MLDEPRVGTFLRRDGAEQLYREVGGAGEPLTILVHGFMSSATDNWISPGHARRIGGRVVMMEMRGHAAGAAREVAAYPKDVLVDDLLALIEHIGAPAGAYVLGGYSAGGRTVARALVRGAQPSHAVIAGMGLEGIVHGGSRGGMFRRAFADPDSDPTITRQLRTSGQDPVALTHVIDSYVDTPRDALLALTLPITVASGNRDLQRPDAEALAAALPNSRFVSIVGDHNRATIHPSLTDAFGAWNQPLDDL